MMIQKIFKTLLDVYGSQNWWPVTQKNSFVPEYSGGPKDDRQKFEVIIGTILTQNTSWKNVEKAIVNLNKENLLDIQKIIDIGLDRLAELIHPSGYFNQKAERLKLIAKFFSKNNSPSRQQLLELKGVGPETADSILLYAFNKPFFVVDAYTKRIFSRIGFDFDSYDDWQSFFHNDLDHDPKLFQEFHALIVEHAKRFCRKSPDCSDCPLSSQCKKLIYQ